MNIHYTVAKVEEQKESELRYTYTRHKMATNGNGIHQEQYGAAPQADAPSTTDPSASASHSKDEVGWYFVQQYYTTLSKNTSKLHVGSLLCDTKLNKSGC